MPEELAMELDHYRITCAGYMTRKVDVSNERHCGTFDDVESALAWIKQDMDDNKYYPPIWWINDHGNAWPIDTEGNVVKG